MRRPKSNVCSQLLWAEVFRVHGDGDYMRWERVSADVVPINISCIEDRPSTVFQVTAYNKHVEKIFDVKITQPGSLPLVNLYFPSNSI
ncbi:protein still life, isoform SIF type 1-like isoform X3 [Crassostrea virginica]